MRPINIVSQDDRLSPHSVTYSYTDYSLSLYKVKDADDATLCEVDGGGGAPLKKYGFEFKYKHRYCLLNMLIPTGISSK